MKNYINDIINKASVKLGFGNAGHQLDKPKDLKFGDISSNIALLLAKELKRKPRDVAQEIISNLEYENNLINKIEIAGPGFINFFVSDNYYKNELKKILLNKDNYGKDISNKGKRANLEWVSANPTKPLHAGHGRQICLGSAIANLLEWTGYEVTREYYYNDAGNQMNVLGKSVQARYEQIFDETFPFPEEGYMGHYVKIIAQEIKDEKGDSLRGSADIDYFRKTGETYNFGIIKNTLEKLNIRHDVFFNESLLYTRGDISELIDIFKSKGITEERDGALWMKMSGAEGIGEDKVIIKSSGEPTYRLPDMAYHIDKIKRGYDTIIDIFGSDHSNTYKEVLFGIKSAGYNISNIKVIIHQMVTFKQGDEVVKMSGRSDTSYYLDELINDIGADATQFFFVMRQANTHLDFDVKLAKEQSDKNPVYYLQYAHARICGILRNAEENFPEFKNINNKEVNINLIKTQEELNLLKILSDFPEEVKYSSDSFEPHRIIVYLNQVAENFHRFYHNNRVLDDSDKDLTIARLAVCIAVKQILASGFKIIGISAPERM